MRVPYTAAPSASVPPHTIRVMGRRRSGRWVPPQPFSLEEDARGAEVRELERPMPVYAWFQLPDRLIRRDDAVATGMTRDALWVEAGRGESKLAAWVWRSSVKHRATGQALSAFDLQTRERVTLRSPRSGASQ